MSASVWFGAVVIRHPLASRTVADSRRAAAAGERHR